MSLEAGYTPSDHYRPLTRAERRKSAGGKLDRRWVKHETLEAQKAATFRKRLTVDTLKAVWRQQFAAMTQSGFSTLEIREQIKRSGRGKSELAVEQALGWYDEWYAEQETANGRK
jgi:hypothetical protein